MSGIVKVGIYVVVVVFLGCLVSPWVYWATQVMAGEGWLGWLAGFPFHRYWSRTVQVVAIVLGLPFVWWLGVRGLEDLGLVRNRRAVSDWCFGLCMGLGLGVILLLVVWGMGFVSWRGSVDWGRLWRVAGTAVVVSVVEEFVFRGVLMGLLVKRLGVVAGLWISTVIFAVAHFLRPAKRVVEEVDWASGFRQLFSIVEQLPEPGILGYGFLTLMAAGLLLGLATVWTRSLWLGIGLHSGWIFVQQGGNLVMRHSGDGYFLPWFGPSLVSGAVPTGFLAVFVVVLMAVGVRWYVGRRHFQQDQGLF